METAKSAIYWDSVAGKKVFATPVPHDFLKKYLPSDGAILEIGCGYGRVLEELRHRGFNRLYGTDCSNRMIDLARHRLGTEVYLEVSDSSHLEFADATFDAVLLIAVLISIVETEVEKSLVSEVLRVLKPGGVVCVNDLLISDKGRRYTLSVDEFGAKGIFLADGRLPVKHCAEDRYRSLFSDFNFLRWKTLDWLSMNGNPDTGVSFVAQKNKQ